LGILGKLFATPIEVYEGLLDVYTKAGLEAKLLTKDSPETIEGSPSIKVTGRDVELVQIKSPTRGITQKGEGLSLGGPLERSKTITYPTFRFHHIIRGLKGRRPEDVKVKLKASTKGLIRKEVVDVTWDGGRLAEALKADVDLKKELIDQGATDIEVTLDEKNDCVRVEYRAKVKNIVEKKGMFVKRTKTRFEDLPSIKVFNICDRIINHVKAV
jgi:hypothetical protein